MPAETTNQEDAMRATTSDTRTPSQADKDAAWGNLQLARRAFILERMRQEGCLASEAARRFDAGER